jgi:long-chain acyl-CoA synthetase
MLEMLFKRIGKFDNATAIIQNDKNISFEQLLDLIDSKTKYFLDKGIANGKVVMLNADFSIESISSFLALANLKNIIIPNTSINLDVDEIIKKSGVDFSIYFDQSGISITSVDAPTNPLIEKFLKLNKAGLVFFSSGVTGKPKGILHRLDSLLGKYESASKPFRTLAFLLFDHIAGIDTLFYTLFSGGTVVIPDNRTPQTVIKCLANNKVEVFPTSPSFLSLVLYSGELRNHDLSSLKIITFGAERMHDSTLNKLKSELPSVRIIQKYGTTEFGSPISKSHPQDPLWIKFDKNNFNYKIEDDKLLVKTQMSFFGNLDSDQVIDADSWQETGDLVVTNGEWIKILGRESKIINVGGQKVFPAEVENVILELDNIEEANVYASPNPFMGQVVAVKIKLRDNEDMSSLKKRIRKHCNQKLDSYKIPAIIEIIENSMIGKRFKRI